MGYKNVCIKCKRVENVSPDRTEHRTNECPECSSEMVFVNHKFRPPKKADIKSWKLIEFLFLKGFLFQHIIDETGKNVKYPESLKEAELFTEKYRNQVILK